MSDARLGWNAYGKSRVRMLKVSRDGGKHSVREISADIALTAEPGGFEAVHCAGNNAACLPTDTMKNTVYVLGRSHAIETIESFALDVGRHFVGQDEALAGVVVSINERGWGRIKGEDGSPNPHAFLGCSIERRMCEVSVSGGGKAATVESGIESLVLMKTAGSGFSGFRRDRLTTLRETDDRVMCTSVTARWRHREGANGEFAESRGVIREALIATFAGHTSKSVQQTLYAMGEAALAACSGIDRVRLSLPNRHYLLADLSPFGLDNPNEIFIPTDEPHGLIEAVVERAPRGD